MEKISKFAKFQIFFAIPVIKQKICKQKLREYYKLYIFEKSLPQRILFY